MPSCFDNNADRWDHERDSRKHDFPTIARLEPKITTALELAILIKNHPNVAEIAGLIDQYAAMHVSMARADDAEAAYKKLAVANESPLTPASYGGE